MEDLTICIRTYKENKILLEKCLKSLSQQKEIEKSQIIIYNDGCVIETLNCINEFICQNPQLNILVVYKNKQIGSGAAFKELYKLVKTTYMIFGDGDDEYILNDGLFTAMSKLKMNNWNFINADDSKFKLHQMTIFNKQCINEHLFINFSTRDDEYMSYIYTFVNGGFYNYPFYKWNNNHSFSQIHFKEFKDEEKKLWEIYSSLVNKKISVDQALNMINSLNVVSYNDIKEDLMKLCETNLFN